MSDPTNITSELLTTAELAKALKTTPPTIRHWQATGRIPAEIAEGRVLRFDLERVRAVLLKRAKTHKPGHYCKAH